MFVKNRRFRYQFISAFVLLLFMQVAQAEVTNVDNAALKALLAEDVVLIDVRRAEEWQETGVVEGSVLMTFFDQRGKYDAGAWLSNLNAKNPEGKPVVLICWTGVRSKMIAHWLSQQVGLKSVYNVTKGIEDWIDDGHPTVR